ncbi:MAG TPA: tRNA glutamyl-Q(34) synthetase GluQRS [Planctomycetota bacterium]|nr:tRNA glutamyl-Q(34) synthetase GluQRS [Planctomycetota bacterium]
MKLDDSGRRDAGGTSSVVGRLAPSPTGALHLGNVRTFMWAWLSARAQGGRVLMRIEDLETPRVKAGATEKMLDDLRWLGFDWDCEMVTQSHRGHYYENIFDRLDALNAIYPCVCTRGDMFAALQGAPHEGDHELRYPGTCRSVSIEKTRKICADTRRTPAWRLKTEPGIVEFDDLLFGTQRIDPNAEVGDFIIARAPDNPAYQLAVVADDIASGVTEVVRGDDLIPSTARQILLYRLLNETPPRHGHAPLIVGPDGKRLAKRHGDARIATFRARGVRDERVIGTLAKWSGLIDDNIASLRELVPLWSWKKVPRERVVLTPEKLAEFQNG